MTHVEWLMLVIGGWIIVCMAIVMIIPILYRAFSEWREDPPCIVCGEYVEHMPDCPMS